MARYKKLALVFVSAETEADDPEEADARLALLAFDQLEPVEFVASTMLVQDGEKWLPVPQWSQPGLFDELTA